MIQILIVILFILGTMFSLASQIPAWFLTGEKPDESHWKIYGLIAGVIWLLLLIVGNTAL